MGGTERSSASRRSNVFICYRREDTAGHAGRLYDRLSARFGADRVFMDVNKIGAGADFLRTIEEAVRSSGVLLALIGKGWATAGSSEGRRRIEDPHDFVRLEIATALEGDLLVIPLLVQGARMPTPEELPEVLLPLLRRNALELANERFDYDVERLVQAVEEAVGELVPGGTRRMACSACGQENPDSAQFCLACGTRLAEETGVPAEERKVVTVLFCDLGFTSPSEDTDPEDVRATLRLYHGLVRREVERFGGTVDKSIGDAVMAVFGAPVAHEDDPERAVRAALRIVQGVPELHESQTLSLAVRIGADAGEAVVSLEVRPEHDESIVTGDVVNSASILQAAAPAGAVAVGEPVYRATRQLFDYAELPPVTVEGKAKPVPIWQPLSARSRYDTEIDRPTTPFIGREDDLDLLKAAYRKALRESSVQLVTVTGEPGVGKSRLIAEFFGFIDELRDLVSWRQGRCIPYGDGITFWALGEIVKAQAGILESDGAEQARDKLAGSVEALLADEKDREWLKARLGPLVGLEAPTGPAERDETFTAWRQYLETVAAGSPLVVVIEDLHWADAAMLDFVEHLVEYATGVPLLVIAGARPELYERRPNWSGGLRNATTISLAPLSDPDCSRLIAALLEHAVLPAEVQAELLARAGGNPLYAEEFVRMLSDQELIMRTGRAVTVAHLEGLELPATVQALIAARLDTLSPERKSLLQDASVIGRVFWSGAVAAMADRDEQAVRKDLHELVRKELVREARTSTVEGQTEYAFWHALVRDVCYAQIPRAERGRRHRDAASWIESLAGERAADHAEFLAHHYRLALDLARASGETDQTPELEEASVRFLAMAGERAVALDVARAESHYRAALELAPPGHPQRGPLLAYLGDALFMGGKFDESEAAYTEAVPELRSGDRVLELGEATRVLSRLLDYRGDVARARQMLSEALQVLEPLPPGRELVRALADLSYDHSMAGRGAEGLAAAERAVHLARELHLDVEEVLALGRRGTALHTLGDRRGLEDFRGALDRAVALGLGRDTAVLYNNLAESVWAAEGPRPALETYRAGTAFAETRGMLLDAYTNRKSSLGALLQTGEWDEALAVSSEVVDWLRAHGATPVEAAMWRAHGLVGRGEWRQAADLVETYLPAARDMGNVENLLLAVAAAALLARGRGDSRGSAKFVEEFSEAAGGQGTWYRAQFLPDLVRTCREAGEVALGETLLEEVPDSFAGHRLALTSAAAALAEARRDLAEGLRLNEEAARGMEGFGWVVEHGQTLLGAGRCLDGLGRTEDATPRLQAARRVFVGLGARPLVAEADALLQRGAALSS